MQETEAEFSGRVFMPPPLGAGGIMLSGCPSVRPMLEIPSFHLHMGPLVHPTNRDRFSACPSIRPSLRPEAFPGERMERMTWCILATFRTYCIMVMVCWFSSIWCHFNLVKRAKFDVSGH